MEPNYGRPLLACIQVKLLMIQFNGQKLQTNFDLIGDLVQLVSGEQVRIYHSL
jgi:hypothetical protein